MTKRKKKGIKIIDIIIIIAIIVILIIGINKLIQNKNNKEQNTLTNQIQTEDDQEKYVEVLEDGTKLNISEKLKQTKKLDNLEIKNIQLTYKDGVTNLLATVSNAENKKIEMTQVEITLLDENKNTIFKIPGIIEEAKEGETAQLNCSVTADFANSYDFKISKK